MNKKILFSIVTCILISSSSFAQLPRHKKMKKKFRPTNFINSINITGQIGLSSYYGDLCDNFDCMRFRPNIQAGIQYRISESIALRSEFSVFRLYGSDEGGVYEKRNLSFRSDNWELNAVAIYDLYHHYKMYIKRHLFSPYGFVGIGVLGYSPKAKYDGEWYKLRPLLTESGKVGGTYGKMAFSVPYGGGVRYKLSPHTTLSFEIGYRWTFTDYLDDVSTTYPNVNALSGVEKALTDRSAEGGYTIAKNGIVEGRVRGNPDRNDGYFMFGIKVEHVLKVTRQVYNINSNPSRFRLIKSIKKKR